MGLCKKQSCLTKNQWRQSGLLPLAVFTGYSQVQDYSYLDYGFCHFYLEHQNTAKDEELFQYFIIIFLQKSFLKGFSYFLSSTRNLLCCLANFSDAQRKTKLKVIIWFLEIFWNYKTSWILLQWAKACKSCKRYFSAIYKRCIKQPFWSRGCGAVGVQSQHWTGIESRSPNSLGRDLKHGNATTLFL